MVKSIVVAIDGTESSKRAQKIALDIASRRGAKVTGVGVLDTPWVTSARAMPIGAGSYKEHRDDVVLEERRKAVHKQIEAFSAASAERSVTSTALEVEGNPSEQIASESNRHDIIIIGRETNFHGENSEGDIGDCVQTLLEENPRPVLVVPPTDAFGDKVVVAFDGSNQSSRAMHMFLLLGLADGREVHVVSVAAKKAEAAPNVKIAADLFRTHGFETHEHVLTDPDNPADTILGALGGLGAGMLVMGAFGPHGLLHRMRVGSATKHLLRECPVPVFVHH